MTRVASAIGIAVLAFGCTGSPSADPAGKSAKLKALYLSATATTATVGEPLQLDVIANIGDGVVAHNDAVTYTSSDEEIARVLPDGKLVGQKAGKVVIHAEKDGVTSNPLELEVK